MPAKQIERWLTLSAAAGKEHRASIKDEWRHLAPPEQRWSQATCGPMAATICTLLEVGWNPILPNKWRVQHHDGQVSFALVDEGKRAKQEILEEFTKTVNRQTWAEAAHHE